MESREWIGVVAYTKASDTLLKRGALLFDKLVTTLTDDEGESEGLERVREVGIIRNMIVTGARVSGDAQMYFTDTSRAEFDKTATAHYDSSYSYDDMRDALSRGYAELFRWMLPEAAIVPLLSTFNETTVEGKRSAVIRVALNHLPLPSAETPWEAILDWRRDEEATVRFRRLRHWINTLVRGGLQPSEAGDAIATLIDDYATYMHRIHRRLRKARWEVVATTGAEVLENLVSLRFSNVAARLFDVLKGEVSLRESELEAPGREVAYLVHARDRFRS